MNFVGWLNLVPVLLGALIAAPLVLEFERGPSGSPDAERESRPLARDADCLVVAASLAAGLAFALLMTWWRDPLDDVHGRFADAFDLEGVVPPAYTLFAAALVLALGVALRRAAAAIGLALVVFLVLRIARQLGAAELPGADRGDADRRHTPFRPRWRLDFQRSRRNPPDRRSEA